MDAKTATLHKFAPASQLGPAEDYPIGSIEWAERISNRLQISANSVNQHTVHHLWDTIKVIWATHPRPWEIWPEGNAFGTPDDYCLAVTGHSWTFLVDVVAEFAGDEDLGIERMQADLARAQVEHRKPGKNHKFPSLQRKGDDGGNSSAYLLRRLARERPDLLDAYESGRFKSVRAAAIEAGFIKLPTAIETIFKLLLKLSLSDLQHLQAHLNEVMKDKNAA
jgi:hypothetical protein